MGGFNSYPALSIKQPNLGNILSTVSALKSAGLKNRLMQSQMKKEEQLSSLRGQLFKSGGDAESGGVYGALEQGGGPTPAAAAALDSGQTGGQNAGMKLDNEAMARYIAIDPEGGGKVLSAIKSMTTMEREKYKIQNGKVAGLILSVEDQPPEQRPMAYQQAKARAREMGIPMKGAPETYNPRWAQQTLALNMGVDKMLEQKEQERKAKTDGLWVQTPQGRKWVRKDQLEAGSAGGEITGPYEKPGSPIKIGDPNSPTGTTYVNPQDAINQPGPPGSGLDIQFGPDGKPTSITTGSKGGGKGGAGGLTRPVQTAIQKDMRKAADGLARLQNIGKGFKPEFLTVGIRFDAAKIAGLERLGVDVPASDQKLLTEFSAWKRHALDNINIGINDITGAAMGVDEAKRIRAAMPDPGEGIFDGDSPTQFKAKYDATVRGFRMASYRYNYSMQNGLDPKNSGITLEGMEKVMRDRQAEIESEARAQNPQIAEDDLKSLMQRRLTAEFGVTFGK